MFNISRIDKMEKNKFTSSWIQLVTSPSYKLDVIIYDDANHWDRNFRLFTFVLWQISNIPRQQLLVFRSIPTSSLRWDSNAVLTFRLRPQRHFSTCVLSLFQLAEGHLAGEKSQLQKDIVIGLVRSLKSYLELQLQAACWTKILRHNQPQDFNQTQVFHKEMIHHLTKENETPVSKSDLSQ